MKEPKDMSAAEITAALGDAEQKAAREAWGLMGAAVAAGLVAPPSLGAHTPPEPTATAEEFDLLYRHESAGGADDADFYRANREAIERARAVRSAHAAKNLAAAAAVTHEQAHAAYRTAKDAGDRQKAAQWLQGHHGDAIRRMEGGRMAQAEAEAADIATAALGQHLTDEERKIVALYTELKTGGRAIAAAHVRTQNSRLIARAAEIIASAKRR